MLISSAISGFDDQDVSSEGFSPDQRVSPIYLGVQKARSDRRHKNPHVTQINVCFMTTPTHGCNFRADVQDVVVEAAPASR